MARTCACAWPYYTHARGHTTRMRVATNRAGILLAIMRPGRPFSVYLLVTGYPYFVKNSLVGNLRSNKDFSVIYAFLPHPVQCTVQLVMIAFKKFKNSGCTLSLEWKKTSFLSTLCQPRSQGDICLPSSVTGSWLSARWGFRCCSTTMRLPADPRLSFINTFVVETNWWVYQQSICCC